MEILSLLLKVFFEERVASLLWKMRNITFIPSFHVLSLATPMRIRYLMGTSAHLKPRKYASILSSCEKAIPGDLTSSSSQISLRKIHIPDWVSTKGKLKRSLVIAVNNLLPKI